MSHELTSIHTYGWGTYAAGRSDPLPPGAVPGRVLSQDRGRLRVAAEPGELACDVAGRLHHAARDARDLPVTGDWVAVAPRPAEGAGTVVACLPRRTELVRKAAGPLARPQVVVANVDRVFVVTAFDRDLNFRRIERYLLAVHDGGAEPVIVLNKADLCPDPEPFRTEVEAVAAGAPVLCVSAATGDGLAALRLRSPAGDTVALVGSSGVGKSSLVNRLLGAEVAATHAVRALDGRGRHTTTRRELHLLPTGACLIDTPGMKELAPFAATAGLATSFPELDGLGRACRFRDCRHDAEPGCAVLEALESGDLDPERYESWRKLQREQAHLRRKADRQAARDQKVRNRRFGRMQRRVQRLKEDLRDGW